MLPARWMALQHWWQSPGSVTCSWINQVSIFCLQLYFVLLVDLVVIKTFSIKEMVFFIKWALQLEIRQVCNTAGAIHWLMAVITLSKGNRCLGTPANCGRFPNTNQCGHRLLLCTNFMSAFYNHLRHLNMTADSSPLLSVSFPSSLLWNNWFATKRMHFYLAILKPHSNVMPDVD